MDEQELRALVRELVARRLAARTQAASDRPAPGVHVGPAERSVHASHDLYVTLVNTGDACVIEPAVPCNHCNYCKSHGH